MTNLDIIKEKLVRPSGFILVPVTSMNASLPFADWEIQTTDVDGNIVGTGTYYTPAQLSRILGNLLVLVNKLSDTYFIMRYSLDWDTVNEVTAYLESMGLANPRKNVNGTLKRVSDVDFTTMVVEVEDTPAWSEAVVDENGVETLVEHPATMKKVGNSFMIVPPYMVGDIPTNLPTPIN